MQKINLYELNEIKKYFNKLSLKNRIKGLNYERCAELPFILERLRPFFNENLKYLDIGSGGESPLPSYLLNHTNWEINCIDKFDWVEKQNSYIDKNSVNARRFNVYKNDILESKWENETFDIIFHPISNLYIPDITPVWQECYRILKPNGRLLSSFFNPIVFVGERNKHYDEQGIIKPSYRVLNCIDKTWNNRTSQIPKNCFSIKKIPLSISV